MIKYLCILTIFIALTSCNGDSTYQKKIPGWYTVEQQLDGGKLIGKITYYKNGALKFIATFKVITTTTKFVTYNFLFNYITNNIHSI